MVLISCSPPMTTNTSCPGAANTESMMMIMIDAQLAPEDLADILNMVGT